MSEEQIIRELKKSNTKVFSQLVDLYKNRIFSMAYKYTNDYNEAQDLAQEVFIKVYKQIHGFKGNSKLSTWIFRISVNTCLDWKRKNSRVKLTSFEAIDPLHNCIYTNNVNDNEIPEDKVINIENHKEIHKMIHNMPDIYKNVIIMYHFNDMSYEQISEALNVPKKTVETRLYRARRALKNQLYNFNLEVMECGM